MAWGLSSARRCSLRSPDVLITLSGLPGSGTSTLAKLVASALALDHLDGGTVFRQAAREAGLTLSEFAVRAEGNDSIDRVLDDRLTDRARDGDVVLESRLAGWLVTRADLRALRVWVACDGQERARRVGGRDGHDLAAGLEQNQAREASERQRYRQYYGIDLEDLSIYDLVLDSGREDPASLLRAVTEAAALVQ